MKSASSSRIVQARYPAMVLVTRLETRRSSCCKGIAIVLVECMQAQCSATVIVIGVFKGRALSIEVMECKGSPGQFIIYLSDRSQTCRAVLNTNSPVRWYSQDRLWRGLSPARRQSHRRHGSRQLVFSLQNRQCTDTGASAQSPPDPSGDRVPTALIRPYCYFQTP